MTRIYLRRELDGVLRTRIGVSYSFGGRSHCLGIYTFPDGAHGGRRTGILNKDRKLRQMVEFLSGKAGENLTLKEIICQGILSKE